MRGNHESLVTTQFYGFRIKCEEKIGIPVYFRICDVFEILPVAAVINENLIAVHGGIIPDLSLEKIERANRMGDDTSLVPLMWADPLNSENEEVEVIKVSDEIFRFKIEDLKEETKEE